MATKKIEDALYDYVGDCLAWDENAEDYVVLLRLMERSRNFEGILKATVTFMKRHGDKLADISDDGIKEAFAARAESQRETAILLAKMRGTPRAAAKRPATKVAADKTKGGSDVSE